VREGIIATDRDGIITTVNRAALVTLGLDTEMPVAGRPIHEILPKSGLMSVLTIGTPDFNREVWLRSQTHDSNSDVIMLNACRR
jgi:two-component system CitB family sensor kinase